MTSRVRLWVNTGCIIFLTRTPQKIDKFSDHALLALEKGASLGIFVVKKKGNVLAFQSYTPVN